jgi:hypothetical protein
MLSHDQDNASIADDGGEGEQGSAVESFQAVAVM